MPKLHSVEYIIMWVIYPKDAYGCHEVREGKKVLESPTLHLPIIPNPN